ncbi:MAG TPA: helix-turn-helix transcriptional regulator [Lacunisphaera sp.]
MANDTVKRLIARVKALRLALGLSQEAFAERAGLKYKHYQSVEAGRKLDIHFSTVEKLAKACGLDLGELLDFRTDPLVIAEDKPESGFQAASSKGARKSGKGTSGKGSRG